ncbi:Peptidoglycan-binding (PGRP) domain of peptidoglycan hydrolases-containing protein [Saccharicrinis carchari]|uniref:Peptidoglycan-binding (PGRP) domain of peptidoglycan hydrolases-containing protein n=1 Tax=Saccharicrinis carchari TaxID=1168039 RepID=A0A521CX49_SACCC|nr:DUF4157 domain-containing protein [Saccharicrinis carchari]SMO63982.1 Peptidoglycan-binding (PGRP) domain of peptidoglycan hydrolases-containing protein [Saccharicrinis carchari]
MKTRFKNNLYRDRASRPFFTKNSEPGFFKAQPKLNIGQQGDRYEQEADRVADKVVAGSKNNAFNFSRGNFIQNKELLQEKPLGKSITPFVQKQVEEESAFAKTMVGKEEMVQAQVEEEEEMLQTQPLEEEEEIQAQSIEEEEEVQAQSIEEEEEIQAQFENEPAFAKAMAGKGKAVQSKTAGEVKPNPIVETTIQASKGGGNKMDAATKMEMEQSFGADFSKVNVHTDTNAVQMSKQLSAQAFTLGNDIYFNEGKYNPKSTDGKHLLAHELTHTIQQTGRIQKRETYNPEENLQSNRFGGHPRLERVYDNKELLFNGLANDAVAIVQRALMAFGYPLEKYKDDGIFGGETEKAVRDFQADLGALMIDGIIGPETMRLLDREAVKMEKDKEEENIDEAEKTILEKVEEELKKGSGDKRAEYALCILQLHKIHREGGEIFDKYMGPQVMLGYIENDRGNRSGNSFKHPNDVPQSSSFVTLDRAIVKNAATYTHNLLSEANSILEGINLVGEKNRNKKYRLLYGATLDFLYKYLKTRMNDVNDIYACFK